MRLFTQQRRWLLLAGLAAAFSVLVLAGCGGGNGGDGSSSKKTEQGAKSGKPGKLTDSRDGQKYRTVKIGNKVWMAENLKYKIGGSWCYEKDESNCDKYGRLYQWDVAMRVCPSGWHLPSEEEWTDLVTGVGSSTGGTKLKAKSPVWNGTNEFGFSALPGGYRDDDEGSFDDVGLIGYWWTAEGWGSHQAGGRGMDSGEENVKSYVFGKSDGVSVRCVMD